MESNHNLRTRLSGCLDRLRLAGRTGLVTGLAVALTACGGGGGSSGGGGGTNQSPTAAITAVPTSGKAPLTVALSGAGSSDTDGTISSYAWTFSDGSPSLSGVTASKTFATPGNYTVTLTVTDNRGATGRATQGITVAANAAPTAAITATPTTGKEPLTVALDGSGSRDTDGTIASYTWSFSDGSPSISGVTASKTFNTAGNYTVTLTVTDNEGATGTATRGITVTANAAPTAAFTATPTSGRAPLLVSFDGSASRDPDGTIAGYQWAFGDGGTGSGATVQHTYNAAGTFTATLTVTDNQGATGTLSRTITVTPPVGSLSVTVKDTNGVGIAGAAVVATVGGASRSGTTNASGVALLTDVLAGTGTVDVSRDSFIAKTGTAVTIAANATTSLDVTLERVTSATGGVLETRVPVGGVTDGGKTLEFSIRVVVVDDKSVEVKGLPATAFTLLACNPDAATTEADCVSGGPADVAYAVLGPGAAPSFQEIAGGPPQPYAATLMFDQSASIIRNDPTDARLFSAKEFLRSLGGSDVAAVAAFADGETAGAQIPVRPVTIYPVGAPSFFSDGTALFNDLDSLAGLEGGGTPLYEAICRVMDFAVAQAPAGVRKAAVVFTDGRDEPSGATGTYSCRSINAAIAKHVATGVDIFSIGLSGEVDGLALATLADAGNGVFLFAEDVTQLIPIYGSLGNLLSGSLTTYRLTYKIQAATDGTFQAGRSIRGTLAVNTGVNVNLPFVVRIF
jgi:PKD repeat protein